MFRDTNLFFLEEDVLRELNNGKNTYEKTENIYKELKATADDYESKAVIHHLTTNLFPTMAYYKALIANGYDTDMALFYVRKETRKSAEIKKQQNQKIAKLPFTYLMYRLAVKGVMKKNFPDDVFGIKWICCNEKEIHFDFHKCIYHDLTKKYGCPELCTVFCENDDISFSGLIPKIRFERKGTLGQGADKCDFHLINTKRSLDRR